MNECNKRKRDQGVDIKVTETNDDRDPDCQIDISKNGVVKTRIVIFAEIAPGVRIQIIFDTGANRHAFKDINLFSNIRKTGLAEIKTADGTLIYTETMGDIMWLQDVYFAPELEFNVISISQLDVSGYYFIIKNQMLKLFTSENVLILTPKMEHGLYTTTFADLSIVTNQIFNQVLQFPSREPVIPMALSCNIRALRVLHKRLGHISNESIEEMMNRGLINLPVDRIDRYYSKHCCDSCMAVKSTRRSFTGHRRSLGQFSPWTSRGRTRPPA